jgi:hypothetical protein
LNIKEAKWLLVRDFGFQSSKIKILEYSQVGDAIDFSVCNTNYSWRKSRGLKIMDMEGSEDKPATNSM